jgi:cob(I)alamin adenosyltransferase
MGNRLSKIVTRTGDGGTTGRGDGTRVPKESARIEACGSVDELNCALGVLLNSAALHPAEGQCLSQVQQELFDLGGELAIPGRQAIGTSQVERLEEAIETANAELPPLKEFVMPGGGGGAAECHVARSICRRAERRCWALARSEAIGPELLRYLNRLSDLLFVYGRVLARRAGGAEVLWQHARGDSELGE